MLEWTLENEWFDNGYTIIGGTDEAGRGPLAGPVYAAAVILPRGIVIDGLNDSKKISEKKREKLFDIIIEKAVSYGIASASANEIDELNILNAAQLAMRRAVAMLDPQPEIMLVDGNVARDFPMKAVTLIKGDSISPNISAASILAKVSRDRSCTELDKLYPEYGFAKHKGYPTREHYEAIKKYGITPEHRRSFTLFK